MLSDLECRGWEGVTPALSLSCCLFTPSLGTSLNSSDLIQGTSYYQHAAQHASDQQYSSESLHHICTLKEGRRENKRDTVTGIKIIK